VRKKPDGIGEKQNRWIGEKHVLTVLQLPGICHDKGINSLNTISSKPL